MAQGYPSQPLRREKAQLQYTARFIRLKAAPIYLGMDKNLFNRTVRPFLTQIPIGRRGIAFDRLELDQWADQYRACNGRPALKMEGQVWRREECQGSKGASKPMVRTSGISTNASEDLGAFQAALARAIGRKPKTS
jgi:predicted DNA-binding transcriptional regulator AlpA